MSEQRPSLGEPKKEQKKSMKEQLEEAKERGTYYLQVDENWKGGSGRTSFVLARPGKEPVVLDNNGSTGNIDDAISRFILDDQGKPVSTPDYDTVDLNTRCEFIDEQTAERLVRIHHAKTLEDLEQMEFFSMRSGPIGGPDDQWETISEGSLLEANGPDGLKKIKKAVEETGRYTNGDTEIEK